MKEKNSLELVDMPKDDNLASREILVKNASFCLCNGSDPGIYNGNAGYSFPMIFGHESGGYIEKTGNAVTEFKIGDRVSWWCTIGTFCEYSKVNIDNCAVVKTPEILEDKYISVLELVIAASRALMPFMDDKNNLLNEYKGKKLLIMGLGPSGLVITQLAKCLGFGDIYGWDLYPMRRERAETFGITKTADPLNKDFLNLINDWEEADIGIDMMDDDLASDGNTFDIMIRKLKGHGRIISYGHPEHGRKFSPHHFQGKQLTMTNPEGDINKIRKHAEFVMELIQNGKIKIEPLVTHEMEFAQVKDVFLQMIKEPEKYIKIIFTRR